VTGLESFLLRFGIEVPRHVRGLKLFRELWFLNLFFTWISILAPLALVNPIDGAMNILNTDFHSFGSDIVPVHSSANALHNFYLKEFKVTDDKLATLSGPSVVEVTNEVNKQLGKAQTLRTFFANTLVLSQRLTINYSRCVSSLAYRNKARS
jgi:hypothetical protein